MKSLRIAVFFVLLISFSSSQFLDQINGGEDMILKENEPEVGGFPTSFDVRTFYLKCSFPIYEEVKYLVLFDP
jgi:hypothetical protein